MEEGDFTRIPHVLNLPLKWLRSFQQWCLENYLMVKSGLLPPLKTKFQLMDLRVLATVAESSLLVKLLKSVR
eukprot:c26154_g1_i1 orf=125-340(+)